jgi:hypothetical protein
LVLEVLLEAVQALTAAALERLELEAGKKE